MTDAVHGRPTAAAAGGTSSDVAAPGHGEGAGRRGFFSRVLDRLGLHGAADEAQRGTDLIREAWSDQPTIERKIGAAWGRAWEANLRTHAAAAIDVARPAVEHAYGPVLREAGEAAREVAGAYGGVVATGMESMRETRREVGDAWNSHDTIERKLAAAGYELWENGWQANLRHVRGVANVGKEVVEGAAEVATSNPITRAQRAIIGGGAKGAVDAGRSLLQTTGDNVRRAVDQQVENAREVGSAAVDVGRTQADNARELGREVSEVWSSDTTIERKVARTGYELVENGVQGTVRTQAAAANVVKEAGEAAVENVVTGARNAGNAVAGGFKAAGSFVGGLLG